MQRLGPDFDAFVTASSDALLRTAVLLCGDRGEAEDLLQAALLRVARRWASVRTDPVAYTRRVLVNLAKDRWRDRGRRVREYELTDAVAPVQDCLSDRLLTRRVLLDATARLPARQRAVLILRYFDELSVEETAAALDCSTGTVKSQTHHALTRLREQLAASGITLEQETPC